MVSIPSRFRGRTRRDVAAFHLSQLAEGLLAGDLGILTGHETVTVRLADYPRARDRVHAEVPCESSLRARPVVPPGPRSGAAAGRRRDRADCPRGPASQVTQNLRCRHSGETPRRETLLQMRTTGDAGEMTARRPAEGPGRRPAARVLVVEDERDVAELIRYNLGKEGYDVVVATNGADALRQAREARPDLVLLDIMVPAAQRLGGLPPAQAGPRDPRHPRDHGHRPRPRKATRCSASSWAPTTTSPSRSPRASWWRACARSSGAARPPEAEERRHRQGRRPRDRSPPLRGHGEGPPGRAHAQGVRAAGDPGRRRRAGCSGARSCSTSVWGRDGFVEPRTVDVHVARLRGEVHGGARCRSPASRPCGASAIASGSPARRNTVVTPLLRDRNATDTHDAATT